MPGSTVHNHNRNSMQPTPFLRANAEEEKEEYYTGKKQRQEKKKKITKPKLSAISPDLELDSLGK